MHISTARSTARATSRAATHSDTDSTTDVSTQQFDMLEVLLRHPPGASRRVVLEGLQAAIEPAFEVEPLEQLGANEDLQIVRFAAVGERFASAAAIDAEVRALAGCGFGWTRIGAIRSGTCLSVRG